MNLHEQKNGPKKVYANVEFFFAQLYQTPTKSLGILRFIHLLIQDENRLLYRNF